ncbi:major capsid protein [Methylobacterium iners]|uniref:Major capsid protein n=1 Tax=Methylobacterium iners TaxID=418707 RepID=A0ABQ4S6N7_9HYPH|nr:major capsid protein [Methylobacterium iners]GJD97473.1 hypothetical protein OCOJLMKI_4704 [Methylobacterium iners]
MSDVFSNDPFSNVSMTDAVNKMPYVDPGIQTLIPATETTSVTEDIQIDIEQGTVRLVPVTARGGEAATQDRAKRHTVKIPIPVYELRDTIHNREVLNRRETGGTNLVMLQAYRDSIVMPMVQSMVHTKGFQRAKGWLEGKVLDDDGSLVLDIYQRLGEEQIELEWDLTDAKFNATEAFIELMEASEDELGAMAADRYVAIAGRNAHANLRLNKEVEAQAQNPLNVQQQSIDKRKGVRMSESVDLASYGRARYTKPDGTTDGFVSDEFMYFSPVGAGQARSITGPSDMTEFWGNPLDFYASVESLRHGKGEEVLLQACFLNLMARPRAVIKVRVIGQKSLRAHAPLK